MRVQVLYINHAGGYGGIEVDDACMVEGWEHALLTAWRSDNAGPASVAEVVDTYASIRKSFPNAKVFASTFDTFVDELEKISDRLPVVELESGDTWYGAVPRVSSSSSHRLAMCAGFTV